jgi:HlyD family secretion protein
MVHGSVRRFLPLLFLLILVVAAVIYLAVVSGAETGPLQASGIVEAVEVNVSPELTGRVVEVMVEEGESVVAGQPLWRLDDSLLQAQRQRATAAAGTAEAALRTAQANLEVVQAQFELALNAARLQALPGRLSGWREVTPSDFSVPVWYFGQSEEITAAEAEVAASEQALTNSQENLDAVVDTAGGTALRAAEARLAQAQAAFLVAQDVLDRARLARETQDLEDFAQSQYDSAHTELEDAQAAYDEALTDETAADVLEARAQVSVAQARQDAAVDRLNQLRTGDFSLQVAAAQAVVRQAEAAVEQARAALTQAEAEGEAIDVQLQKLVVLAPTDGVIVTRSLEEGEVILAGGVAMTIGRLDNLTITVYIPEDRYGEIELGQHASVTADSFPGETFDSTVTRIADRAEFTPRNVQTQEGRRTTVFAVELSVSDPAGRLKPGMPADVGFGLP